MFDKEEQELMTEKSKLDKQPIPQALDDAILQGMMKAKQQQKKTNKIKWSSLAASLLLIVMLTSIRVSPTFAGFVSQLPGMSGIVELIRHDKGLSSAIENDFFEPVNVNDIQNGLGFTVDGMIIDESRLILFYTVENFSQINFATMEDLILVSDDGSRGLQSAYSFGGFHEDLIKKGKSQGQIDVSFSEETVIPEVLTLQASFLLKDINENLIPTQNKGWEISFPIDHSKFVGLKKEFKLNESVVFAGQQLTFKNVTIFPTRMEVDVEFAEENTMKITNFEDLKIVNEKGEAWTGTTGVIATHLSENHWKLFLESNYFHEGNELYLQATSIRAIPKNEVEVVVDLQNKSIIKGPESLVLDKLELQNDVYDFQFSVETTEEKDQQQHYGVFEMTMYDENKQQYEVSNGMGFMTKEEGENIVVFSIQGIKGDFLHLTLADYPSRITDEMKLKLIK